MHVGQVDLIAALLVGLFGTVHCVGMCGGIAATLATGMPTARRASAWRYQLAYNVGRIASYTLAGALVGGFGALLTGGDSLGVLRVLLQGVAGLFMILLGLYLAGWSRLLARVESGGARLWRHVEPLGRRLLPLRSAAMALPFGLVWGWLPCGLVYSVLAWATASGNAASGAAVMLAFGLGTMPSMLVTGLSATRFRTLGGRRARVVAGVLVVLLGLASLGSVAMQLAGHGPQATHAVKAGAR